MIVVIRDGYAVNPDAVESIFLVEEAPDGDKCTVHVVFINGDDDNEFVFNREERDEVEYYTYDQAVCEVNRITHLLQHTSPQVSYT